MFLLCRGFTSEPDCAVHATMQLQKAAWKSGHKVECNTMVPAGILTPALSLTKTEMLLLVKLYELEKMRDWLGVLRLEEGGVVLANKLRKNDPQSTACILTLLGLSNHRTGGFARARELHKESRAIWEALGNRAEVARACGNLGLAYESTGDYKRAEKMHEKARAMFEALGDNAGVATACGNLANCFLDVGDYGLAHKLYEESKEMWEALGNRAGLAKVCNGLGNFYDLTGDYNRARELHEQDMAICESLGDREALVAACGNLGNCYFMTGDYERTRVMHEKARAISKVLGNRVGLAVACCNLGICCLKTEDYGRAISHFTEQYAVANEMQVKTHQGDAALGMGVALRLKVRVNVRACAAGASELPILHASQSVRSDDTVREAEKWLKTALELNIGEARLHLAHLALDTGDEHTALTHLQGYLSWYVERAPIKCNGCGQNRGANAPMLTCGGCRVARFCNAKHQKMASTNTSCDANFFCGKHKNVCGLLGKWRLQVVKGGMSPDVLHDDLLALLRR